MAEQQVEHWVQLLSIQIEWVLHFGKVGHKDSQPFFQRIVRAAPSLVVEGKHTFFEH